MKQIALLGSSYTESATPNSIDGNLVGSWPYHFANDYPNLRIDNFAKSAHGVDYAQYVLDWMIQASYSPSMIILEIPSLSRKFTWLSASCVNLDDMFRFESLTPNNLYDVECFNDRLLYSRNQLLHSPTNTQYGDFMKNNKDLWERHILTHELHSLQTISFIKMIPYYSIELNCPIYYYSHGNEPAGANYSNFSSTTASLCLANSGIKNYMFDESHFNTKGNTYLYHNFIKTNHKIHSTLEEINE